MKKRICLLVTLLAIVIMGVAMSVEAAEIVDRGYCGGVDDGKNLTWTLDSDGVLVIEGQGEMKDWTWEESDPEHLDFKPMDWHKHYEEINSVIVRDGVTSIGDLAFAYYENLGNIDLSESLVSIGEYAFLNCTSLSSVYLPKSLTELRTGVFAGCTNLGIIDLPQSLKVIWQYVFSDCDSLRSINIPLSVVVISEDAFWNTQIKDIYYGGTQAQWNAIEGSGELNNYSHINATIHYVDYDYEKLNDFVSRLYRNFLKREPDEKGLADWVEALVSGRGTGAKLVSGFVLSKEYQANSLSDEEYVTAMYRIIFKREPDAAGLQSWITVLDNGCTNKKILEGFINSDEFDNLCKDLGITQGSYKSDEIADNNYLVSSFVARLYRLILGRRYDREGLDNWVRALVYGTKTASEVVRDFIGSKEFQNRHLDDRSFVIILYQAILDREPDESGLRSWTDVLDRGYTREKVLEGFLKSTEFDELCKTYGIESYDHKTEKPDTKISYNVQYIRTNGYVSGEKYPKIFWITSADELKSYFEANKDKYNLGRRVDPYSGAMGFMGVAEQYDTVFFEENDLIVIVMEEGSGSIRHEVSNLHIEASQEDGMKYVIQPEIIRILPGIGTCDMAEWHIIIEISKDYGKTVAQLKMPIIIDVPNRRT